MKYSVNTGFFSGNLHIPMEELLPMLRRTGFEALDHTGELRQDNWKENADRERKLIEQNGLSVSQTHAPYNRYGHYGSAYAEILRRSYEVTKILGAEYLVVHGDEFDFARLEPTRENMLRYNYEIFAPYVERAEKDGISIAFETVFQEEGFPTHRYCSRYDDLKEMIGQFGSKNVCCCWDFGHANLAFGDKQPEYLKDMGSLVKCTHIHDNYYERDLHLPPMMGKTDWNACAKALRDIGYAGTYNMELAPYWNFPREMMEEFVSFAYDCLKRAAGA